MFVKQQVVSNRITLSAGLPVRRKKAAIKEGKRKTFKPALQKQETGKRIPEGNRFQERYSTGLGVC